MPSETFCATIQAIVAVGARPRFVEVSPHTLCVESQELHDALKPTTRAVIPVLYGGRAVELSGFRPTLQKRGITVIEDGAHAFGSRTGTTRVGATGDLTCFSFGPIKNLTCISGGAVVPRSPDEADALRQLRALGITQPQAERIRTTTYDCGLHRDTCHLVRRARRRRPRPTPVLPVRRPPAQRAVAGLRGRDGGHRHRPGRRRHRPHGAVQLRRPRPTARPRARAPDCPRVRRRRALPAQPPAASLRPVAAPPARHRKKQLGQEILSLPFHPAMTASDAAVVVSLLEQALEGVR